MREGGGVFVRVKKRNYLTYLCLSFANKLHILIFCNVLHMKVPGNISQRFAMFLFLFIPPYFLSSLPYSFLPFLFSAIFIYFMLFVSWLPFSLYLVYSIFMECKNYEDCAFLGIIFIYYLCKVSHSSETRAFLCMSTKIKRRAVRLSG